MTESSGCPPIQTHRLVLRELVDADFKSVHAYATDPVVVQFMPWGPNSESETRAFLTRAQEAARAQPRIGYELAVTLRDNGTLVGAIGLHREAAESLEAMLGYCFARSAWGHGYATEAGLAMVEFGFTHLGLESVWAGCDVRNTGSVRVLKKLGMTLQGRHRHPLEGSAEVEESFMFRVRLDEWTNPSGTGLIASI